MTSQGITLIILYMVALVALAFPLGHYMAKVFNREHTRLDFLFRPIERGIYKITHVKEDREMNWKQYAVALLLFNFVGLVFLYVLLRLQAHLPLNPQGFTGLSRSLSFNTSASFVTNTNWQAYSGETTMSHFSQMMGLTVQNFFAPATGLTVVIALIRGFVRKGTDKIGNFWVDLTRALLWVLIPLAIIVSLLLVWQGTPQTLNASNTAATVEGSEQTIPVGPMASQESIKDLGTNGGGFFNANSAHPYENPTPLANAIEMLCILLIGAGLCITFGTMVGKWQHGMVILAAMLLLFSLGVGIALWAESSGNPRIASLGVSSPNTMEGKEVRFGIPDTTLFVNATTDSGCGSVNAAHDSLTPIGGMIPLLNIMLGEVIFGGTGTGLGGMIVFAIIAVFIVGLMVGRTPEYLGKKIQSWEIKMSLLVILIPSACILIGAAIAAISKAGTSATLNPGPHGLSEIVYAYASSAGNNGSAFAGLSSNTVFYNTSLGIVMLIARFGTIVPLLAIGGSIVPKQHAPVTLGTFRTDRPMFPVLLSAVVLIVGALTFFAVLALGPIVEHLMM